jgi:hypothetical protein
MIYTLPLLIIDPIATIEIKNLMWRVLMRIVENSKRVHISLAGYKKINKKPTCKYYNNNLLKDYWKLHTNDIVVIID